MKIGIDARMYRSSVAGIGRYSQNLIKNLLEIDTEDQFVLFMTDEDYREFEKSKAQNPNVKIQIINIPHYSIAEQTKLPKIIERENLDLMHFLNFNYPVRYKGKFIVTIHDLTLLIYPQTAKDTNIFKQSAYKYTMKKACQNALKIIAVSQNTKKDIVKKFKIQSSKIKVIYEAADDIDKFKNQKSKCKIKEKYTINKPVILYVGQYREHKNIKGLLETYKILKETFACQLVLVGNVPENYKNIIDNDPNLRDILRPGFVTNEELTSWYKIASVFCFPSFYEGFGLPGLEAMMMGTPVVASKTSSLPEIYKDAALYFDPSNSHDIADKIKIVLSNEKMSKNLSEKGKLIVKSFSWRKTAEETLKVYKEV